MDKELDEKLVKAFPNLYMDRYGDKRHTAMCWGFPEKGWFKIIWNLSKKLEKMILELPEEQREYCKAVQVKEKFGGLRFYMSTSTEEMEKEIHKAAKKSYKTCEFCGKPGKPNEEGWIITLCPYCRRKENKRLRGDK